MLLYHKKYLNNPDGKRGAQFSVLCVTCHLIGTAFHGFRRLEKVEEGILFSFASKGHDPSSSLSAPTFRAHSELARL